MKRVLSVRFVMVALVVAVAVGTFALLTPPAGAFEGICTYYSNANMTTVVGQRGTDCCGNPVSWGRITAYRECHVEYCIWCPPPTE